MFKLDPKLKADTIFIEALDLSDLLLMNDSRFPWLILVPRRENMVEIFDLTLNDQQTLWKETIAISEWAKKHFKADKMNVAAIGNIVSQLHVHIVVRKKTDVAWPKPVWGVGEAIPYENLESLRSSLVNRK